MLFCFQLARCTQHICLTVAQVTHKSIPNRVFFDGWYSLAEMPRTRPLPQREQEVCSRIVQLREDRRVTRAQAARAIGVSRFTLANIERRQSPLRFSTGYNLCLSYNVSLRWLATGDLPKTPFTRILPVLLEKAGAGALFSNAYDQYLAAPVEARLKQLAAGSNLALSELAGVSDFHFSGGSAAEGHLEHCLAFARQESHKMSDAQKVILAKRILDVVFGIWNTPAPQKIKRQASLDNAQPIPYNSGVQEIRSFKAFITALKKRTAARGVKAKLARRFKVSRQAVNQWLSSEARPSAEIIFKLLKWVEQPEDKIKIPSRVRPQPGRKTQVQSIHAHEKDKTSDPKRE
jgi:transcriptional regulator with XRE-family HTH domain